MKKEVMDSPFYRKLSRNPERLGQWLIMAFELADKMGVIDDIEEVTFRFSLNSEQEQRNFFQTFTNHAGLDEDEQPCYMYEENGRTFLIVNGVIAQGSLYGSAEKMAKTGIRWDRGVYHSYGVTASGFIVPLSSKQDKIPLYKVADLDDSLKSKKRRSQIIKEQKGVAFKLGTTLELSWDEVTLEVKKETKKKTKSIEHKEVAHDETDKVAMEPNDFQFVGSYKNKFMHCIEESEKEELTSKLEEILRKYGLLGLQGQLLFDDTVLDKRAYEKQ